MISSMEVIPGMEFLLYDETFNHSIEPKKISILDYEDGFINHSMYEYVTKTSKNFYPVISPTKELSTSLFPLDELVDLTAIYYKSLIREGEINTLDIVRLKEYDLFINTYPELMI